MRNKFKCICTKRLILNHPNKDFPNSFEKGEIYNYEITGAGTFIISVPIMGIEISAYHLTYLSSNFMTIEKYREQRLGKLLDKKIKL